MGRSFHWMDRELTLKALDDRVSPGGALAFFDDDHPHTTENAWRRKVTEIGVRYGRNTSDHILKAQAPHFRGHQSLLLDSPFHRLSGMSEFVRRTITSDDAVGLAFSLSTSSPERLGDRRDAFEAELRAELDKISPDGLFTEIAELSALIAARA